jgi:glycerate kinase
LNATLVRGIDQVLQRTGFQDVIQDADWVITGEGRLDMQSLGGKVVSGVTKACQGKPTKVAVFAGQVDLSEEVWQHHGIDYAMACTPHTLSQSQGLNKARTLIKQAVTQWAETVVAR